MERTNANYDAQNDQTAGTSETYHPFWAAAHRQPKTRHEGEEGTVGFWKYMKVLYKDYE